MYTAFYGLREKPFSLTPNPRFLFLADSHREAMAHLLYGLEQGEGFIVITGEVGTGKTTVCRSLLERLGPDSEVAILFNPSQSASELLQSINEEFGLPAEGLGRRELLSRLNRFLLEKNGESRRVVLIIDEAQNLSPGTLEQVRLLSNLETASRKLIQIILLGQPELDEKLDSDQLRQLRQRVSVRWNLQPLPESDAIGYIRHRLRVAAGAERDLFSESALREIHRRTAGIPRLINVLTDRALLAGYAAGQHRIGRKLVRQAARELPDGTRDASARRERAAPRWPRWTAAAALALAMLSAGVYGFFGGIETARRWLGPAAAPARLADVASPSPVAAAAVSVAPPAPPLRGDEAWVGLPDGALPIARIDVDAEAIAGSGQGAFLAALLSRQTEEAGLQSALNAVVDAYGAAPIGVVPQGIEWLEEELASRSLALEPIPSADFEQLRAIDYPALLELRASDGDKRTVALISLAGGIAELAGIGPSGRLRVPVAAVEDLWDGEARVVWRPYEQIPTLIGYGDHGAGVYWLQEALGRLGHLEQGISGRYDERTIRGVKRFQSANAITPDGMAGPLTLMLLYGELDDYAPPRLAKPPGDEGAG